MRSPWPVLAVAALLVTAGCLGVGGGDGGTAVGTTEGSITTTAEGSTTKTGASTTTRPGGPAPPGASTTPGATEDPADDRETTPSPPGSNRSTDDPPSEAADAVADHRASLRSAGNFTSTVVVNLSTASLDQDARVVYRVDFRANRSWMDARVVRRDAVFVETLYTAGNVTHQRVGSNAGRTHYRRATAPYDGSVAPVNVSNAMGGRGLAADLAAIDLTRSGERTHQGERMARFTAEGAGAWDLALPGELERTTRFEMTILVDDRGIVRRIEYLLEGRTDAGGLYRQHYALTVSSVGSTDVPRPDWLELAE